MNLRPPKSKDRQFVQHEIILREAWMRIFGPSDPYYQVLCQSLGRGAFPPVPFEKPAPWKLLMTETISKVFSWLELKCQDCFIRFRQITGPFLFLFLFSFFLFLSFFLSFLFCPLLSLLLFPYLSCLNVQRGTIPSSLQEICYGDEDQHPRISLNYPRRIPLLLCFSLFYVLVTFIPSLSCNDLKEEHLAFLFLPTLSSQQSCEVDHTKRYWLKLSRKFHKPMGTWTFHVANSNTLTITPYELLACALSLQCNHIPWSPPVPWGYSTTINP